MTGWDKILRDLLYNSSFGKFGYKLDPTPAPPNDDDDDGFEGVPI